MDSFRSQAASITPISQLISTWTDLDVLVDVEDGSIPIDTLRAIQRPLRDVKNRFETPDPLLKIVCPRLLPTSVPSCVIELNDPRDNKAEVRRRFLEDRCSIARQVLAQKGAIKSSTYQEDDCWIQVTQGDALLMIQGKLNTAEERAAFDRNPGPGSVRSQTSAMPIALIPGQLAIIPALSVFFIAFNEDTLMFMGDIVPFGARREVDPYGSATRAAEAGRTEETATGNDNVVEEDGTVTGAGTNRKERRDLAKQEKKEAKKAKKVSRRELNVRKLCGIGKINERNSASVERMCAVVPRATRCMKRCGIGKINERNSASVKRMCAVVPRATRCMKRCGTIADWNTRAYGCK